MNPSTIKELDNFFHNIIDTANQTVIKEVVTEYTKGEVFPLVYDDSFVEQETGLYVGHYRGHSIEIDRESGGYYALDDWFYSLAKALAAVDFVENEKEPEGDNYSL